MAPAGLLQEAEGQKSQENLFNWETFPWDIKSRVGLRHMFNGPGVASGKGWFMGAGVGTPQEVCTPITASFPTPNFSPPPPLDFYLYFPLTKPSPSPGADCREHYLHYPGPASK